MRAAAAHGMTTFKIFNFILNPTVYIDKVETIFKSPESALPVLQRISTSQLMSDFGEANRHLESSVLHGTSSWEDYKAFGFTEKGLVFLFEPYHFAAYSYGFQKLVIKWRDLAPLLHAHILEALGLSV